MNIGQTLLQVTLQLKIGRKLSMSPYPEGDGHRRFRPQPVLVHKGDVLKVNDGI